MSEQTIWEKLQNIDNRVFYWILFIGLMVPFVTPLNLPITISDMTNTYYNGISKLGSEDTIILNIAAGVGSWPEVFSALTATASEVIKNDVKIVIWTSSVDGQITYEKLLDSVPEFSGYTYGVNYVYLGYYAGGETGVAQLAKDIRSVFKTDYIGTPIDDLSIMNNINSAEDIEMVVSVDAGDTGVHYVRHWHSTYDVPIGDIATGVLGSTQTPFWKSGDFFGLIISVRGAAELEKLVQVPGDATTVMDTISVSHLLMVIAVILANIGFYMIRRDK